MPLYEYYCRDCDKKFEMLRPMSRADEDGTCPQGHAGAPRLLSVFASFTKGEDGVTIPVAGAGGGGCGSCGGGACASCGVNN